MHVLSRRFQNDGGGGGGGERIGTGERIDKGTLYDLGKVGGRVGWTGGVELFRFRM